MNPLIEILLMALVMSLVNIFWYKKTLDKGFKQGVRWTLDEMKRQLDDAKNEEK